MSLKSAYPCGKRIFLCISRQGQKGTVGKINGFLVDNLVFLWYNNQKAAEQMQPVSFYPFNANHTR